MRTSSIPIAHGVLDHQHQSYRPAILLRQKLPLSLCGPELRLEIDQMALDLEVQHLIGSDQHQVC